MRWRWPMPVKITTGRSGNEPLASWYGVRSVLAAP
jgi:hypothetical protein